jgi:hypothetical protein
MLRNVVPMLPQHYVRHATRQHSMLRNVVPMLQNETRYPLSTLNGLHLVVRLAVLQLDNIVQHNIGHAPCLTTLPFNIRAILLFNNIAVQHPCNIIVQHYCRSTSMQYYCSTLLPFNIHAIRPFNINTMFLVDYIIVLRGRCPGRA